MAEGKEKTAAPASTGDRVQMLSVAKDGSLDQHDPVLIGDKDATLAATKEQFATQAVAAAGEQKRAEVGLGPTPTAIAEDPSIAEVKKAEDTAAKDAAKRAESAVNALHEG